MSDKKNKKQVLIIVAVVAALVLAAGVFWLLSDSGGFRTVTPHEAMNLIKTRPNLLIVDVREQDEMSEGWIDGTRLMPLSMVLNGQVAPPKDRPILLICAVGGRSLGLGKAMVTNGWTEVYNLEGGIANWKAQGLPLKYQ